MITGRMKIDVLFAPHFSNLHDENVDLVPSADIVVVVWGNAFLDSNFLIQKQRRRADKEVIKWNFAIITRLA